MFISLINNFSTIALKKLKNKKLIERLFQAGFRRQSGRVSMLYLSNEENADAFAFSVAVPKRNMPKAVDRNRLKRQFQAAVYNYCLWKEKPENYGVAMFFYHGRNPEKTQVISEHVEILLNYYFYSAPAQFLRN